MKDRLTPNVTLHSQKNLLLRLFRKKFLTFAWIVFLKQRNQRFCDRWFFFCRRQSSSCKISSYTETRLLSASSERLELVEGVGEEEVVGFVVVVGSSASASSSSDMLMSFFTSPSSLSSLLLRSSMTSISPTRVEPSLKSTRFLWARRQFWKIKRNPIKMVHTCDQGWAKCDPPKTFSGTTNRFFHLTNLFN